jgi:SAM-dependent methyltransferase
MGATNPDQSIKTGTVTSRSKEPCLKSQPYATRFRQKEEVVHYDSVEYAPDSYASYIWSLQKPTLKQILTSHRSGAPTRLLDFACGTGRVLSYVENFVDQSDGLDISPEMAELAKAKCRKANVTVGDILKEPELVAGDYDFVTMFRFLLNTEEEMRLNVLAEVRKRLVHKNGWLIANIHGNTSSVRSLALAYRRIARGEMHSQLSRPQIRRMFEETGYRIEAEYGLGILPPALYRTFLAGVSKWTDSTAQRVPLLNPISIDLLYVCQPI